MSVFKVLLFIVFAFLLHFQALAMRCSNQIIEKGDTVNKLLKLCGKPQSEYNYTQPIYGEYGLIGEIDVHQWVYQRTPQDFVYTLTINDGKITQIDQQRQ